MKRLFQHLFLLLFLACPACGKKKNTRLARNHHKLAMLALADGQADHASYKTALGYIEDALAHDRRSDYLACKATILFKLGKFEQASACFKKALAICRDSGLKSEILNNFACLLADVGHDEQAQAIWQQLEHDQNYLTPEVALLNQGKLYAKRKVFEKAKKCFAKAAKIAPSFLDAHYYLALMNYELHDIAQAKDELKMVLYLDPQHAGAKMFAQSMMANASI